MKHIKTVIKNNKNYNEEYIELFGSKIKLIKNIYITYNEIFFVTDNKMTKVINVKQ